MGMNLFEIEHEILGCVDEETGEVFDMEKFEALSLERDAKIENLALWMKNLKAEAEALKEQKNTFAERQKTVENKMNSIKSYLQTYLDGAKFKTPKVAISYRKSDTLEIEDVYKVPEDYLRYKEPEVNKTELKKAIKSGQEFEGVTLVTKQNIQIR